MSIKAMQDYVYVSKYARFNKDKKRRETWNEAVDRVMDMHLRKFPNAAEDIEWAFDLVRQKRVLGSQRALQFGGKPIEQKNSRIYNCLAKETKFITSKGVKSFLDFNHDDECIVLTHEGNWKKALVKCYGKQQLHEMTITRGRNVFKVKATKNHRWLLKNGEETQSVSENDQLMFGPNIAQEFVYEESSPLERLYWAYGYVYGDGTCQKDSIGEYKYSQVRLCGKEVKYLERFIELGFGNSTSASLEGDVMVYTGKYTKTLPDSKIDSPELIRAFVHGYLAADECRNSNVRGNPRYKSPSVYDGIQATGEASIKFIRECFPIAGVYIVSEEDLTGQVTNYGVRSDVTVRFRIISGFGQTAASFTVADINKQGVEEDVWCLEVEDDHSFVLSNGLVTGNCCVSFCDRIRFFQETFWLLLCGCGTGFSVQKHHIEQLPEYLTCRKNKSVKETKVYQIPDSIEGWADSLGVLLATYFPGTEFPEWSGFNVEFDYSLIRPAGTVLTSGVGKAPGPEALKRSLIIIKDLLEDRCTKYDKLRTIDAYDIVMHASDAVLSGGVRRSATICLFSPEDDEMLTAKTGNWFIDNPQRARSNNSVMLIRDETTKEQFKEIMKSVKEYGEPGFVWSDHKDLCVNPCVEIGMYPVHETGESGWQMCNLCEINGKKIKHKEDFALAAKAAAIIGTLQASYTNFDYLGNITKEIVEREALLGVSITGMMDNSEVIFNEENQREMAQLVVDTNKWFANKIGINQAARTTCVKPAGCLDMNTKIKTSDGVMSLLDIFEKQGYLFSDIEKIEKEFLLLKTPLLIFNENNQLENVSKLYVNGVAEVYEIPLEDGSVFKATPWHKFKLSDGSWRRADELQEGDDIITFK